MFLKNFVALFLVALVALPSFNVTSVSASEKDACKTLLGSRFKSKIRYPAGRQAGDEDIIKFGFESEYTFDRLDGILTHYAPKEEFISRVEWDNMGIEQRVEWFKANKNRVFETTREAGGLELHTTDEVLADMIPKNPILDDTGNVELVLPPDESLENIMHKIEYINAKIGNGSMQATVGLSQDAFFLRTLNIEPEEAYKRNLGYLNVVHDLDVLEKMSAGYARWMKDPTKSKLIMRSFDHHFLGPMTKMKHDVMSKLLKENTLGQRFEKKYMDKVAFMDSSFKYTGSTSYRPDIAYKHDIIVLEARDAHSDMKVLTNRIVRNMDAMRGDRVIFKQAADLKPFDSVADFQKFPEETQKFLEDLFPTKIKPEYGDEWYQGDILLAAQVYRNFAYPLRNWDSQIKFLGDSDVLRKAVEGAQEHYLKQVNKIQGDFAKGTITKAKAQALVQSEAAYFADHSGLQKAYASWYEKNISSQTTEYTKIIEKYAK